MDADQSTGRLIHLPNSLVLTDKLFPSVLAGPTCDSIDVIAESILLPKLQNDDLIISTMMGAYCSCTATDFNFFKRAEFVIVNEQHFDESIKTA